MEQEEAESGTREPHPPKTLPMLVHPSYTHCLRVGIYIHLMPLIYFGLWLFGFTYIHVHVCHYILCFPKCYNVVYCMYTVCQNEVEVM